MADNFEKLTIIIIVQEEDREAEKSIESIIACNDIKNISLIVYNNSDNETFHKWASEQNSFIYAYSETGIEKYGKVVYEIVNELCIDSDVLLVSGHQMAYPGIISGMYEVAIEEPSCGIVAAGFNGDSMYGLGYETYAGEYMEMAEYSLSYNGKKSRQIYYLDSDGSFLIKKEVIGIIKQKRFDSLDRRGFVDFLQSVVNETELSIQLLLSAAWWNLNDRKERRFKYLGSSEILLTIAIPTYNRGKRALEALKTTLENRKKYGGENVIEVLVSDNASEKYPDALQEIEDIAEKNINVSFYRSENNKGYKGNIKKIIKLSKGKYCLIHSDEDTVRFPAVLWYIEFLLTHNDVSCMKGRTPFQYNYLEESYGKQGIDALNLFFQRGNYVSGIVYNRSIITDEFIDSLYEAFDGTNNIAFDYYPHLFIDTYALCNGGFASSNIILIDEGEPEDTGDMTENEMFSFERPESRIAQGSGYIKQLDYLEIDDKCKVFIFCKIILKTMYLLNMSKRKYLAKGYIWDNIVQDAIEMFKKEFADINIQDKNIYKSSVLGLLDAEEINKLFISGKKYEVRFY
jgi:hypothetical protein